MAALDVERAFETLVPVPPVCVLVVVDDDSSL